MADVLASGSAVPHGVPGSAAFHVPFLELSFALDGIGVTSTSGIGLISAATAVGSGLFGRVSGAGSVAGGLPGALVTIGVAALVLAVVASRVRTA